MKNILKNKKGFTLVELLLYIAIVGVLVGSVGATFLLYSNGKTKAKVIADVEYSGNYTSRLIEQTIRDASSIVSPATSTASGTMSLAMASSTLNPTVFKVISNRLYITEGVGSAIPLTPALYTISSSTFINSSKPNSSGSVSYSFTMGNISNNNNFSYQQTFYGSATIRK